MYTFYLTQTLGCTVEEAAELEFEPIILFNKLNIAIGSFYNETEEPYVVVYNSLRAFQHFKGRTISKFPIDR